MAEIKARPPNYEKILAVFPGAAGQHVIFAYAPDIYVPSGNKLPEPLVAHESVHIERQQAMGVDAWWDKYLTDLDFRYEEELLAHRAEYQCLSEGAPRQQRRYALKLVAKRLTSELYGKMVSMEQAMAAIKA